MIKTIIVNRIIKREVSYLLEVSSIKWKVIPNSKRHEITLKSMNPNQAWVKVSNGEVDYRCADATKEKEIRRIVVGLKIVLDEANKKIAR
ncbi:hypothetical protein RZE82_05410 [Mollicutes bacterium LVI A0039]|nr:hypothetical protein RZE82_05410 [Mollicutes bacterium LVI A0039]